MTLIAIHLLQNHAPSNLNRDDNGDPKDAFFGGVRRARISSQAIKRSIRTSEEFRLTINDPSLIGQRTQLLPEWIRAALQQHQVSDEERDAILYHAARFGKSDRSSQSAGDDGDAAEGSSKGKGKAKRGKEEAAPAAVEKLKTQQLMFLTIREVEELTETLVTICRELGPSAFRTLETEKDLINKRIGQLDPHAVDVAMFGRMTTSSPFKDVEAAVQVAHAISTHKIEQEFDYYTAVDDRSSKEDLGAGFIGDVAFNSATYYKYINICWEELLRNLHNQRDVARLGMQALVRAAMTAIPTGKQNTFAAHNLPDFALVEILGKNIPLSYANAFLKPVRPKPDESLMEASVAAFRSYAANLPDRFNIPVQRAVFSLQPDVALGIACHTLDDLSAWMVDHLPESAQ